VAFQSHQTFLIGVFCGAVDAFFDVVAGVINNFCLGLLAEVMVFNLLDFVEAVFADTISTQRMIQVLFLVSHETEAVVVGRLGKRMSTLLGNT
jgi:hypothetical protein